MVFLTWKSPLATGERMQRRRLILSDALALSTLFLVVVALAIVTTSFYRSYASHRAALARRWLARGEAALQSGKPDEAVNALRSSLALAPAPEERKIEVELAEALASAGRTQEAISYFNTLSESEPGNGMINLQLARLAVRQGNTAQALEFYHRAIYGNWEGNGYIRRREVRMELVRFLISHNLLRQAQSELIVAAGNAPENDTGVQLEIARTMELAKDPGSALNVYKTILQHHPSLPEALAGAGRTAFQTARYLQAKHYLERAVNGSHLEQDTQLQQTLHDVNRLLLLNPSSQLPVRQRSERILADRQIALARLTSCVAQQEQAQKAAPQPSQASQVSEKRSLQKQLAGSLASLASHLNPHRRTGTAESQPSESAPPPQPDPLQALASRWKQQPPTLTLSRLESNPDLAQAEVQLIYDTERVTQQVCGAPTGDDALLLKIAQAPGMVEQE